MKSHVCCCKGYGGYLFTSCQRFSFSWAARALDSCSCCRAWSRPSSAGMGKGLLQPQSQVPHLPPDVSPGSIPVPVKQWVLGKHEKPG